MAFQLVEGWQCAHKWISTNCMLLAGAVQGAWMYIPADMKASVPPALVSGVTMALLGLGIVGRMVKQVPTAPAVPEDPQ